MENRCRLVLEVVKAVVDEIGPEKVGIRFSPFGGFLDASDSHPYTLYAYLLEELNKIGIAYGECNATLRVLQNLAMLCYCFSFEFDSFFFLVDGVVGYLTPSLPITVFYSTMQTVHFVEPRRWWSPDGIETPADPTSTLAPFRAIWNGAFLAAGGYQREDAMEAIKAGDADMIVFGRRYLANPDFVLRMALDAPLNPYDRSTFYSQEPKGYTDYPYLEDTEWGKSHEESIAKMKNLLKL